MALKTLELVGYKTFASKSTFVFADSITAVVGPNGSGKSNIADALRWVLGEQSYTLLRGKKTIDMIFSGSQERSPAGMASATITFDNSDGWLPIDFSEVSVTRRAYRDGLNEYLINNQKVRLRDVAELLGHSGLAERTYTIIGQGLVDAALSLKAEERRRLFEEAAGIGVYRARRADALRRLDLTRRNLERVGDILSELRPRLRSLERQARRVEEFEQIQSDLHVLLRDWYGYHWHNAQADLAEARESARAREKELGEVRARKAAFDQQILDLRDRIHQRRALLSGWQVELGDLRGQRERIVRELAVAGERQRASAERAYSGAGDRAALNEEIRLQQERLERTLFESEALHDSAEEARRRHLEHQTALDAYGRELEERSGELADHERTLKDLETRIAAGSSRLDAFKSRTQSLAAELSEVEREAGSTQAEVDEGRGSIDSAQAALNLAERHLAEVSAAAGEHTETLNRSLEQIDAVRKAIAAKSTEAARLAVQLEVLRQAEAAGSGLGEGARTLLHAGRDGRLAGVRGPLAALIEAPANEIAALYAALGEYYDAVFIETESDTDGALALLISADLAGAVIPISRETTSPLEADPPSGKGLPALADLIRCPADLRPVFERLFARVFVAETGREAEEALSQLPGGSRVVTREGVLYTKEGMISFTGSAARGSVERPRRIRELESALVPLQSEIAGLAEEERSLSTAIETMRAREVEWKKETDQSLRTAGDRRAALRDEQAALEQAGRRSDWLSARRANLQSEIGDVDARTGELQIELAALANRSAELKSIIDRSRQQIDASQVDEMRREASHWQTRAAVALRAAEDARARVEDRRQTVADLQNRLLELERQISTVSDLESSLQEEIEKLKTEERQMGEQVDRLAVLIEPVEEELRKLEIAQDSAMGAEAGARQNLSAAERNHSQAQITLARRQEHLENLRQKIEDDFGLVSLEYDEEIAGPNPLPLGSFVETLPKVIAVSAELGESIKRQRTQLRRMGAINPDAKKEFDEVRERFQFLTGQLEDLTKAEADILEAVGELDLLMEREFRRTFDEVAREFRETFTRLFGGGSARLVLTDPDDLTETGVDIEAQLPGRRLQGLSLLSGGERSLTATALVLSLIKVSPTPFCVLDEVDAMLDEANVFRLADLLRELSERTQFIIITHNRNTVQAAETIYGITMGRDSTSQVLSLKLDEVRSIV